MVIRLIGPVHGTGVTFRNCLSGWIVASAILAMTGAHAAELKAADFALMDRLTWGVTPSMAEHLKAIGFDRWIDEQLHPQNPVALPPAAQSEIEAMPDLHRLPFDIITAFDEQAKSANR